LIRFTGWESELGMMSLRQTLTDQPGVRTSTTNDRACPSASFRIGSTGIIFGPSAMCQEIPQLFFAAEINIHLKIVLPQEWRVARKEAKALAQQFQRGYLMAGPDLAKLAE
jgi:hypothetical protein